MLQQLVTRRVFWSYFNIENNCLLFLKGFSSFWMCSGAGDADD